MTNWYLVYCKARQESAAARGLEEQGYDVYLPSVKTKRRRAQGMVEVITPLFPRYLFVTTRNPEQSISPAQYTAGVGKVVRFGIEFLQVPAAIIAALRAREDPETGFHRLAPPTLRKGDRVRIEAGAFAGIEGIFEACSGRDRVIILFELLGRRARTDVAIEELKL